MTTNLPPVEKWLMWKELDITDGKMRLLTPWSDPHKYEFPMDWMFKTSAEAEIAKNEHAPDENWYLVEVTLTPEAFHPAVPCVECPECGEEAVRVQTVTVNSVDGLQAPMCDACGHVDTSNLKKAAKVRFVAQAWIRDNAVDVDPQGPTEFEVPEADVEGMTDCDYSSDPLKSHENAPQWVKDWSGPFSIYITRDKETVDDFDDEDYFDDEDNDANECDRLRDVISAAAAALANNEPIQNVISLLEENGS